LLWLIVTALLVTGFLVYRSRSRTQLNVTPDAAREIEKAKRQ
jgi:hypothetical protein